MEEEDREVRQLREEALPRQNLVYKGITTPLSIATPLQWVDDPLTRSHDLRTERKGSCAKKLSPGKTCPRHVSYDCLTCALTVLYVPYDCLIRA